MFTLTSEGNHAAWCDVSRRINKELDAIYSGQSWAKSQWGRNRNEGAHPLWWKYYLDCWDSMITPGL